MDRRPGSWRERAPDGRRPTGWSGPTHRSSGTATPGMRPAGVPTLRSAPRSSRPGSRWSWPAPRGTGRSTCPPVPACPSTRWGTHRGTSEKLTRSSASASRLASDPSRIRHRTAGEPPGARIAPPGYPQGVDMCARGPRRTLCACRTRSLASEPSARWVRQPWSVFSSPNMAPWGSFTIAKRPPGMGDGATISVAPNSMAFVNAASTSGTLKYTIQ